MKKKRGKREPIAEKIDLSIEPSKDKPIQAFSVPSVAKK